MAHQWRFFRSGGFDQVRLDRVDDWQHLDELDPKLWAALSCPVKGLEFSSRTMSYLDSDQDGRVRIDEVKAAVRWAIRQLKHPDVLLSGDELPLAAIETHHGEGQTLLNSAKRILTNLGKPDAHGLTLADVSDLSRIFPADQLNGDGVITSALVAAQQPELTELVGCMLKHGFSAADRSGADGVNSAELDRFVAEAGQVLNWRAASHEATTTFGEHTASLYQRTQQVRAKVTDYFTRSQLCSYDESASSALNASAADFSALAQQLLDLTNVETAHLPLAKVTADASLPLTDGVHPQFASALADIAQWAQPLWGAQTRITLSQWQQLEQALAGYASWQQATPNSALLAEADATLENLLHANLLEQARSLMALDLAQKQEADSVLQVDKLVHFQAHLRLLLKNFVNFETFYQLEQPAIFQNGRLYIDGRSCDLCLEVTDAAKHAKLAGLSGMYLLYVDCVRSSTGEKRSIVAAMTAGDAGNLQVGRNGVYYDRQGRDWDATVARLVENPISIREAFFTPYKRLGRMVSDQVQKFAAAKDKEIETKSAAGVGDAAKIAESGAKPAPFDVAKFAGIFAAIGLAIGAIGTAFATLISSFLALSWWQMPLALLGIILFISGPSMLLAWFKLRARNLAPLLDANGWAVNTNAKLSLRFGSKLTALATLPVGSSRTLVDPYEQTSSLKGYLVLGVLIGAVVWAWQTGLLARWLA